MPTLDYETSETATARDNTAATRFVIRLLLWVVGGLPASMLFAIYASFCSATLYLGRMPAYGNPEPKTLPAWIGGIVLLQLPAWGLLPLGFAVLCRRWLRISEWRTIIVGSMLAALAWVILLKDPMGALDWLAD